MPLFFLFVFPGMEACPDWSCWVKAFCIMYTLQIYLKALIICIIYNSDPKGIEIPLANPPGKCNFPAFITFSHLGPFHPSTLPFCWDLPHCTSSSTGRLSKRGEAERSAVIIFFSPLQRRKNVLEIVKFVEVQFFPCKTSQISRWASSAGEMQRAFPLTPLWL